MHKEKQMYKIRGMTSRYLPKMKKLKGPREKQYDIRIEFFLLRSVLYR